MKKFLKFIVEKDLFGEFHRPATIYDAELKLSGAGWKPLGRGVFGTAYSHPKKDYILKLFKRDVAYRKYLDLITAKENIHFPKLRGLPMKVNDNYSAVRMEKLKPLSATSDDQRELHALAKDYVQCLKKLDGFRIHNERDVPQAKKLMKNLSEFSSKYPELADALNLIQKHVRKTTGAGWDLHGGNVMFRGKTLVVTDPVAYGNKTGSDSPIYKDPKQLNLNFKPPKEPHLWKSPPWKPQQPKPPQQPAWKPWITVKPKSQPQPIAHPPRQIWRNKPQTIQPPIFQPPPQPQPQPKPWPLGEVTPLRRLAGFQAAVKKRGRGRPRKIVQQPQQQPSPPLHWTNFHQSQPNKVKHSEPQPERVRLRTPPPLPPWAQVPKKKPQPIPTNTFMDNIRKAKEKQQPIQPWIDTQRPDDHKKKGKRGRPRKIDIERARILRGQGMKYKDIAKVFNARTAAVWMALNKTPQQKHRLHEILNYEKI